MTRLEHHRGIVNHDHRAILSVHLVVLLVGGTCSLLGGVLEPILGSVVACVLLLPFAVTVWRDTA